MEREPDLVSSANHTGDEVATFNAGVETTFAENGAKAATVVTVLKMEIGKDRLLKLWVIKILEH